MMQKSLFRDLLTGGLNHLPIRAEVGLTILRVGGGLGIALGHGFNKIPPPEPFVDGVGELGFPVPAVFAWLAALSESLGGLLLAIGLFTRPAALLIVVTMAVAAFGAHASDPLFAAQAENGSKEMALLFLIIALAFLLAGSGRFSVDHFLRRPR